MKTKIWVVTHKKYKEIDDDVYKTIHVGRSLGESLGYLGDNTGDNISDKNRYYCELTGIYWLWKNYECDIIGICHYRRFFLEKERLLTKEYIEDILNDYDIIIPQNELVSQNSVKEQYCNNHCSEDWSICKQVVKEKYPEYIQAFECMENSRIINICNMFVTRKEIYDRYCEWLFDILFEIEKRIDIDSKDDYQKRVMGFLSERLLKVWLLFNDYKVKEQSIKLMDSDEIDRHFQRIELERRLFRKLTTSIDERYLNEMRSKLSETIYCKYIKTEIKAVGGKVPVWICWWQGIDNAPELVKCCVDSVRRNIDLSKAEIHIITLDNCMEYVTFSPQVIEKFNAGKISMTTLSDRLRMELLYRYGGLWIDATYYVNDRRINTVFDKDFYTQKTGYPIWDDDVVKGRWAGNFIKGMAGFPLFGFVMQAFDEYYTYRDDLIEYFMIDYFIEIAYEKFDVIREVIDECEINNKNVQFIASNGNNIFRKNVWDDITRDTWLFKLSYKKNNRVSNIVGEPTYYGHIISC